jgi:peptidyl-prolyl cis-trans isomerase B (cyclophilin B)
VKKVISLILVISMIAVFASCGNTEKATTTEGEPAASETEAPKTDKFAIKGGEFKVEKNPVVTITMENGGVITAELYPDVAPQSVFNFISLASQGFYDGLIFHRVIPGFMIQGGDPNGTGMGGPGYSIVGEFAANGFENNLSHERGVLSMARSQAYDSAGSQFFIMVEEADYLDGQYAAFGKVTSGMEVADAIVSTDRDSSDRPLEDQVIKSITVETFGEEYPEPDKIQ